MPDHLNVFVTGASSGIGRATAIELATRGHRVFAGARRAAALDELAQTSPRIEAVPIDVTDEASVRAAVARVDELTAGHGIDVLVNGAGYALRGPVEALATAAVEHHFATNVFGLLTVTRAFLPAMRARRSGRVINLSSVVGRFVLPGLGAYSASKFAVEALSDALRMELAEFGVSVVLIEPSWVATNIAEASAEQTSVFTLAAEGYEKQLAKTGAYIVNEVRNRSIPAEAVARQIVGAAETRKPKSRYVLPGRARFLVRLFDALPDAAADRAKRRTVGLA
jgi:NAD(P)-dependent dehydrogenase (short-subunit alcohol dehydrogenase family)